MGQIEAVPLLPVGAEAPFVYGLVDPIDPSHIRYVGLASNARRPYSHVLEAKKSSTRPSYKVNWIRGLQSVGREPGILLLEKLPEHASRKLLCFVERCYILSLCEIGHRLTNQTPGGDGFHGEHTAETKALMSRVKLGNKMSFEARAKSSATQRGRKTLGRPHTQEHREWISAHQKELYKDGANREIQRATQQKAWSDPELRAAHSARMKACWAKRRAQKAVN